VTEIFTLAAATVYVTIHMNFSDPTILKSNNLVAHHLQPVMEVGISSCIILEENPITLKTKSPEERVNSQRAS
jgi:hypothetical protein